MRKLLCGSTVMMIALLAVQGAAFAAVQYDQNVTNNVIYGSGNSNGGFTTFRNDTAGVELGLRAHKRFPSPSDNAAGIMSQGNGTYGNFEAAGYGAGNTRASWNFDWSINSNYNGSGNNLDAYTYLLQIDYNPGGGTTFLAFDPLNGSAYTNGNATYADHDFGNNGTAANSGTNATDLADYNSLIVTSNLVQNSAQLNFFNGPLPFDPYADGNYTIILTAFTTAGDEVASTRINVLVGDASDVPEPMSLAVWGGLGLCAFGVTRLRRKSK